MKLVGLRLGCGFPQNPLSSALIKQASFCLVFEEKHLYRKKSRFHSKVQLGFNY